MHIFSKIGGALKKITLGVGPTTLDAAATDTSIVITLAGCTAGRSLVIAACWAGATVTITGATCPGETVDIHGSAFGNAGIGNYAQFLSVKNVQASGDKTITISLSATAPNRCAYIAELIGGNTASWFDAVATATGTSATPSVALVTGGAGACIFAIGSQLSPPFTHGAAFTAIATLSVYNFGEYELDAGAAGSKTVDFSGAGSSAWSIIAASFNRG